MRMWLAGLLALFASRAVAEDAVEPWIASHPLHRIQSETLVYRVVSWKGLRLFSMEVGTTTFTLSREDERGEPQLVLRSEAKGGLPAFPYEALMTSRLREADLAEREAEALRTKPSYKLRKLVFTPKGVDYLKHKHCKSPTLCHNSAHRKRLDDGSEGHCADDECRDPKHHVWHMAARPRFTGRAYDLLGALYVARGLPVELGKPAQTLRVVSADDVWDVEVRAEKEETVKVPVGEIPCLKITMATKPVGGSAKKRASEFDAPFGLHGNVTLYVDKETRQLVLVRGQADIGTTFEVEVALIQRKAEYLPPQKAGSP